MNQRLKQGEAADLDLLKGNPPNEGGDTFLESSPPSTNEAVKFTVKDEARQKHIADLTLFYHKHNDLSARNEIIQINMGLIGKVIRKYLPVAEMMGVTLNDLENVGVIGLMKAIERYDPEKAAFSTYALDWIRNEVQRHLQSHGAPMRLPSQLARILPSIYRTIQILEQQKGHAIYMHHAEPYAKEIAERINASVADVLKCIRYAPRRHSLQSYNNEEDEGYSDDELISQIKSEYSAINDEDSRMDSTLASLEDAEASALVNVWLAQLPTAEMRTVICHTYGLGGLEVLPFQRLTQVMRMSPSQIKAIREEALEIMRVLARSHEIKAGD